MIAAQLNLHFWTQLRALYNFPLYPTGTRISKNVLQELSKYKHKSIVDFQLNWISIKTCSMEKRADVEMFASWPKPKIKIYQITFEFNCELKTICEFRFVVDDFLLNIQGRRAIVKERNKWKYILIFISETNCMSLQRCLIKTISYFLLHRSNNCNFLLSLIFVCFFFADFIFGKW